MALLLIACSGTTLATSQLRIEQLLARLDHSSRLYRDNALRFTCDETVLHATPDARRKFRYRYIYVNDAEQGLLDYRLPRRGESTERIDHRAAIFRAYNWIFLFERSRWPRYAYVLEGDDTVLERPAYKVRFEPRKPIESEVNGWYGTAWIDRESFQLLRVRALQLEDHGRQQAFRKSLADAAEQRRVHRSSHRFEHVLTEFGVERDGIRFPSEVVFSSSVYRVRGGRGRSGFTEREVMRIEQRYDNYRFYGVDTEVEILADAPD